MNEPSQVRILCVIPAYNEGSAIQTTVGEVKEHCPGCDILVVDDGSRDDTAQSARRAGARVVRLPFNVGVGGAVQTGLKVAVREGYDVVIRLDGDGQHDARFAARLLAPVLDGNADLVIGSRFLPPNTGYQSSFVRRIGIHFFSDLISFLVGIRVTDPTSGFVALNKTMTAVFARVYPLDFPEPEAVVIARRMRARIAEVPVTMRQRATGQSSIRYLWSLYYMIKVTFAIILNMLKEKETLG